MMNIAVVVYSLTGNNAKLAHSLARALNVPCIEIQPKRPVKGGTIFWNLISGSAPKSAPKPASLAGYDKVVFVAPIWMGMAAFPLRPYLRAAGKLKKPYAFLTIDGASEGGNPGLEKNLAKRAGSAPAFFLPQHIRSLLSANAAQESDASKPYLLTEADGDSLAEIAVTALKKSSFLER